jgi:hypothetical protein
MDRRADQVWQPLFHALYPSLQISSFWRATDTFLVAFGTLRLYDLLSAPLCGQVLRTCRFNPIAARLIDHVRHCPRDLKITEFRVSAVRRHVTYTL